MPSMSCFRALGAVTGVPGGSAEEADPSVRWFSLFAKITGVTFRCSGIARAHWAFRPRTDQGQKGLQLVHCQRMSDFIRNLHGRGARATGRPFISV